MTTYEPGTVAVATVRGVPNVRVVRCGPEQPFWWTPQYVGDSDESDSQWRMHDDRHVTDVHPLVVLDLGPDADHKWEWVRDILRNPAHSWTNSVADQIEAQTKPPRIPEPGLWGVVEAVLRGDEKRARLHYVRTDFRTWTCVGGARRSWSELIDPVLVRDGIEAAS